MAKGGKLLSSSRSERLTNVYMYGNPSNLQADEGVELQEEDVWSMGFSQYNDPHSGSHMGRKQSQEGGPSLPFEDGGRPNTAPSRRAGHVAPSAPVNVPARSPMGHPNSDGFSEVGSDMLPPHEYLAREYARGRNKGASSMFEGVGRTLKGRDMRRMRDAVWRQTGFDG